jgi:Flp pilus assembly protein TadG
MSRRSNGRQPRRGAVAILVALLLTGLLGVLAVALEGGLMADNRRRAQAAADAAAQAPATSLFQNYPAIEASNFQNYDPNGSANSAALASAATNGFGNDGTTSTVTVNIPPKSGPFTGKACYAEVYVTYNQPRYFSVLWGSASTPITTRAVARGTWGSSGTGILVLDPSLKDSLDASGTGAVTVTGGANVIVDSANAEAGRATGGGGLTAPQFLITGGYTGTFNGTVQTGVPPTPDPLAYLPVPDVPPLGTLTTVNVTDSKGKVIGHNYTLTPGRYTSLPNFVTGDTVTLEQASASSAGGIYYLDGCGFTSTGANIQMDPSTSGGVMLYNNPSGTSNSQGIAISGGSATISLSALTSGPYTGILFWQNRTATQTMSISGSGNTTLEGTFYTANALLKITGNGNATIGSQYISRTLSLSGNGNILIDYKDNGTARPRDVSLVE